MTAFSGSALLLTWKTSSGTTTLSTDARTFTYDPEIELYEETAGGDTSRTYVNGLKNGRASFAGLLQAGGTALIAQFNEGQVGTIDAYPEGTASGKPHLTIPAICTKLGYSVPYNNLVEIAIDWQQNGIRTDA
jgi:hypothetical protein